MLLIHIQNITMSIETNALWNVWNDREPLKISDTEYTLRGFSIAALRTNFYIKELGIMFDAGLSANLSPDHIFVTHSHSDHIASLPFHLYSTKQDKKIQIYTPKESCKNIDKMMQSMITINTDFSDDISDVSDIVAYDLIPVAPPNVLELIIKGKKFKIEIIKCDHCVPCVGYGFIEMRNKLKEEYSKLSGKEIGTLKKQGIEVCNEVELPIFCFLGDTSREIFENKTIEKYKNIMIECTFINDEDIERADKVKHIHWKHLEPFVKSHPNNTFILYHFSGKYKKIELHDFFKNVIANGMTNVIPWIN